MIIPADHWYSNFKKDGELVTVKLMAFYCDSNARYFTGICQPPWLQEPKGCLSIPEFVSYQYISV